VARIVRWARRAAACRPTPGPTSTCRSCQDEQQRARLEEVGDPSSAERPAAPPRQLAATAGRRATVAHRCEIDEGGALGKCGLRDSRALEASRVLRHLAPASGQQSACGPPAPSAREARGRGPRTSWPGPAGRISAPRPRHRSRASSSARSSSISSVVASPVVVSGSRQQLASVEGHAAR